MGTWNELHELAVRSRGLRARADRQLRVSNILHIASDDRDGPAADEGWPLA